MTTPFTAYAFPTADAGTVDRTLPARLADIKNVKDFGATGNGVADDWAAIVAAINWRTNPADRGIIYFPPGTYYVSQSIDYYDAHAIGNIVFRGELGLSTVVGNFADYVFRRMGPDSAGDGGVHAVEGLTVINTHATGGGIRIGYCVGAAVRDCVVTANLGINTATDDVMVGVTSQEVAVENCTLRPYDDTAGSIGIMMISDGPIINCNIVGFERGIIAWGQQGCQNIIGCHIELCGTGVHSGAAPTGPGTNSNMRISGCYFKNCGTAIIGGGAMVINGIRIEAAAGTIAGDPQYGIQGSFGACSFAGVIVTGEFQHYGISLSADGSARNRTVFCGVQVTNTAGLGNWDVLSPAGSQFIGCNYAPVATVATLPAFSVGINTEAWTAAGVTSLGAITAGSGGVDGTYLNVALTGGAGSGARANIAVFSGGVVGITMVDLGAGYVTGNTLSAASGDIGGTTGFSVPIVAGGATTLDLFFNISGYTEGTMTVSVLGATPSGYDGTFTVLAVGTFTKIAYPQSNPGSPTGSGGTAVINFNSNALEGDCYNVSDSDVATWAGNPVGGGSTHAKVRWNGSDWTVVGK